MSWNAPHFDEQNGKIRSYVVYIDDVTNGTSWKITTNNTKISITNLQPFFQYNCSVSAFTTGEGPISNPYMVTLSQAGKLSE